MVPIGLPGIWYSSECSGVPNLLCPEVTAHGTPASSKVYSLTRLAARLEESCLGWLKELLEESLHLADAVKHTEWDVSHDDATGRGNSGMPALPASGTLRQRFGSQTTHGGMQKQGAC